MKVLVACEFSGTVREAFRKRGHDAYSCDIEPSSDDSPYHIQDDVLNILEDGWDLMIAHPPCTYLTTTGNRWFKEEYKDRFIDRLIKREEAIDFFKRLAEAPIERRAIENPVGVMSTRYRKPDQIICPTMFGHTAPKRTCLWLYNLPKLFPTEIVEGEYVTFKSGKRMPKWYSDAARLPPKERAKVRNKTFEGVAEAMADQWGG